VFWWEGKVVLLKIRLTKTTTGEKRGTSFFLSSRDRDTDRDVLVGGQSCPIENMVDENFDRRKKRNFVLFKYIYRDRDRDLI
jgi:hypothetical protein